MRSKVPAFLLLSFAAVSTACAQEMIYIRFPAELAPGAAIADAVLNECLPEERLGGGILNAVLRLHNRRTRVAGPDNVNDKVFQLTILNVLGTGGGSYSGRKTIHVRADVVQNGTVLASREFERPSRRSRFKGTCALLEVTAKDLGREVAMWLPAAEDLGKGGTPSPQAASQRSVAPAKVADPSERMRELKQMRDEGLISDKEYEEKRSQLLKAL